MAPAILFIVAELAKCHNNRQYMEKEKENIAEKTEGMESKTTFSRIAIDFLEEVCDNVRGMLYQNKDLYFMEE